MDEFTHEERAAVRKALADVQLKGCATELNP
jgi:hypothetical protein